MESGDMQGTWMACEVVVAFYLFGQKSGAAASSFAANPASASHFLLLLQRPFFV